MLTISDRRCLLISVVRQSSKWSSWYYVNQTYDHSLLYQRLRCVCRASTTHATTLERPRMRTQQRHCPADTISSSSSSSSNCPSSVASSNPRPPIPPPLKPQTNKPTYNSHNEVPSDGSADSWPPHWSRQHQHQHLHQYCNCRDLGALRVCRRCPSTGFTRARRYASNVINDTSSFHRIN